MKKKILLFTTKTSHHFFFINQISKISNLAVVFEERKLKQKFKTTHYYENQQHLYEKIGTKIYRISEIDYFNDILGVSSIINACDLIITCSNVNAHLSGALGKKTFCIIGPTDQTLPRFISMKKIVSDIYDKNREVGINRCGDNFIQNDLEVKTISVQKVFDTIVKYL